MDTKLAHFLIDLSLYQEKFEKFEENPAAYLSRVNLSTEAKEAIVSRDKDRLRELLGDEWVLEVQLFYEEE